MLGASGRAARSNREALEQPRTGQQANFPPQSRAYIHQPRRSAQELWSSSSAAPTMLLLWLLTLALLVWWVGLSWTLVLLTLWWLVWCW